MQNVTSDRHNRGSSKEFNFDNIKLTIKDVIISPPIIMVEDKVPTILSLIILYSTISMYLFLPTILRFGVTCSNIEVINGYKSGCSFNPITISYSALITQNSVIAPIYTYLSGSPSPSVINYMILSRLLSCTIIIDQGVIDQVISNQFISTYLTAAYPLGPVAYYTDYNKIQFTSDVAATMNYSGTLRTTYCRIISVVQPPSVMTNILSIDDNTFQGTYNLNLSTYMYEITNSESRCIVCDTFGIIGQSWGFLSVALTLLLYLMTSVLSEYDLFYKDVIKPPRVPPRPKDPIIKNSVDQYEVFNETVPVRI